MAANATAPSLSPCQGASRRKLYSMPLSDRKSTRLNSSHSQISYAVLCLDEKTHEPGAEDDEQHDVEADSRSHDEEEQRDLHDDAPYLGEAVGVDSGVIVQHHHGHGPAGC